MTDVSPAEMAGAHHERAIAARALLSLPDMSSAMSMFVPLQIGDWHPEPNGGKGYFKVRALSLPSVKIVGVRTEDGELLSREYYEVKRGKVRWKGGIPPAGMQVELQLKRRLLSAREALLAGVFGVLLGGYSVAYHPDRLEAAVAAASEAVPRLLVSVSEAGVLGGS